MNFRSIILAALIAVGSAGVFWLPALDRLDGNSLDALFWLRSAVTKPAQSPGSSRNSSPAVVIAIDEETYRRPPFRDLPDVMWTPQLAAVVDAVVRAEASVVGFDIIYTTSVEKYLRGFDQTFFVTLRAASRKGKVVLGKVQHNAKPLSPYPAQSFAVGHQKNIRSLNVFEDDDGIIRRVPLTFQSRTTDGKTRIDTSMALELASRAAKQTYRKNDDGSINLAKYRIPGSASNTMLLDFGTRDTAIPTYSLADIYACATTGGEGFLKEHFAGKVVLLGTALDTEDRKLTSKRLITKSEAGLTPTRCTTKPMDGIYRANLVRDTIPGVFIHATAVNNILNGAALRELNRDQLAAIGALFAFIIALLVMTFRPLRAGIGFVLLSFAWVAGAVWAFRSGLALPLFDPLAAGAVTLTVLLGYKAAVSDKDKRYIRRVFSYYLPPAVIERMVQGDQLPKLGGELRVVTMMFSDVAKFTTLSEGLNASQVAGFLNEYLTEMSDIIEAHDGFIEKFVADEITAVFGAPVDDEDHAVHAVLAGLASVQKLRTMTGAFGLPDDRRISSRFGVNTGELLVGNMGSNRRFNYATLGDAANLGSRLEGANKFYGTDILVGEETARQCGDRIVFREIDTIRVVGRETPVRIFEPLASAEAATATETGFRDEYEGALADYRARKFTEAAGRFEALGRVDPVSAMMAERARDFAANPPNDDWDGVFTLDSK